MGKIAIIIYVYTGEAIMSKKGNNRFEIILKEKHGFETHSKIIKDKETGILYLFHAWGFTGGLTPLLGQDGNPLTDTKK